MKTTIPACERGASPSGVDDPRIIEYRSILIIIRLLINLNPHPTNSSCRLNLSECLFNMSTFALQIINIMKASTKHSKKKEEDSDSDGFDYEEWKRSKVQTQELPKEQFKKGRTNSDMDSKKTVKYKEDPVMNSMYEKILRESDKFQDLIQEPAEDKKELYEYNPHIICGKLTNIRRCNEKQKAEFSLQDENECQAMDLTQKVIVVLVGKIGYAPIDGINANLFIPKEFYEYMQQKDHKNTPPPERLVKTKDNRFVVWIKRAIKSDNSMNTMSYPYLILDPHNLLYPTYLCSWIDCKRHTTLNNYIQGEKDVNEAIVYGSTCHRLLEWLAEKVTTVQQYYSNKKGTLEKLYNSMLYDMYLVNSTFEHFLQVCSSRLDNLVKFYERHIQKGQELEIQKYQKIYLKIQQIVSSEYMFRSNFFGLKGKVDLLLAGTRIDKKNNTSDPVYIPMELKTGKKVSDSHRRQTDIYNILVRQKYKASVVGLLYYSDSDIKFIRNQDPLSAFEIIIVHRNQVAQNLVRLYQNGTINLPGLPNSFNQCNFCQQSNICQISYNEIEDCNEEKSIEDVPSKYHKSIEQKYKKYTKKQLQYVAKWFKMIHLQEIEFKKLNTDYWKMGISNFVLSHTQLGNFKHSQSKMRLQLIHHCRCQEDLYIFEDYYKTSMKIRIVGNQLNMIEGCKIVSTSGDLNTKMFRILVQMNNLEIEYSPIKLQYFIENQQDFDIEIETFQNTFFGVMRNTVLGLADSQTFLKDILIKEIMPQQNIEIESDDDYSLPNLQQYTIRQQQYEGLNQDQKNAYKKSILQQKFCLIEGMPGTGKTELIIRLIEKFSKMKKTVLITTFTNRSLDNILERLIDSGKIDKEKIIREGAQYACSKTLKEYTSNGVTFSNLADYQKFYGKKTIWFVTLNSLYIHHLPKMFDVAILDEASQCLEPTCIEGLLRAQKFILIGDYRQLQPVIKSKEAYRKGMCLSLFERLCKLYPSNCVSLRKQYRMNYKIMTLSNKLVYNGELQLASNKIKDKQIKLVEDWKQKVHTSFENVISPKNSIVFVNYDPIIDSITRKYKQKQPMIRKIIEAELPAYIFRKYIELSTTTTSVSVIAAMNTSVNKIVDLLKQSKTIQDNNGAILTIDKSQGIDKDIIILLIERGNEELVQNPRRLNVALTRAKSKLIIIGSDQHLSKMKVWDGTLGRMLKQYQIELTKAMINDMMNVL